MKMRTCTLLGYKSWLGMMAGLLLSGLGASFYTHSGRGYPCLHTNLKIPTPPELHSHPIKRLDFRTPYELFFELSVALIN